MKKQKPVPTAAQNAKIEHRLMEIIFAEQLESVPPASSLERWGAAALDGLPQDFALRVVNQAEMTQLNADFANKSKPTNVLSFPLQQLIPDSPQALPEALMNEFDSLGDIAICAEVVAQEAHTQGKTLDAHWAHMIVHGVLHLRGFDHIDEQQAKLMEAEEIRILATLGFANPYHQDFATTERA